MTDGAKNLGDGEARTVRATKLDVSLKNQAIVLSRRFGRSIRYQVSTAVNGPGCRLGTSCTPIGVHRIRLKIGDGCPVGTVFVSRRPTGETFTEDLRQEYPGRDWILSRILWLEGLVPGINRYGNVDTLRRFVYIHGTAEEQLIGTPASHGCIRMKNDDVMDLFDRVHNGLIVCIAP